MIVHMVVELFRLLLFQHPNLEFLQLRLQQLQQFHRYQAQALEAQAQENKRLYMSNTSAILGFSHSQKSTDDVIRSIYRFRPEEKTVSYVEATVVGRSNDSPREYTAKINLVFRRDASSSPVIIDEPIVFEDFQSTDMAVYFDVYAPDNEVRIQCRGIAGQDIDWVIAGTWFAIFGDT
jgi:hypothetical protein